jgi:hypothetical protein
MARPRWARAEGTIVKTGTSLLSTMRTRCTIVVATAALASTLFVGPVSATFAAPSQSGQQGGIGGLCKAPEAGRAATGCVTKAPVPGSTVRGK